MSLDIKRFGAVFMSLMILSPSGGYAQNVKTADDGRSDAEMSFVQRIKNKFNSLKGKMFGNSDSKTDGTNIGEDKDKRSQKKKRAAVGGGIGVGALLILIGSIIFCVKRKDKKKNSEPHTTTQPLLMDDNLQVNKPKEGAEPSSETKTDCDPDNAGSVDDTSSVQFKSDDDNLKEEETPKAVIDTNTQAPLTGDEQSVEGSGASHKLPSETDSASDTDFGDDLFVDFRDMDLLFANTSSAQRDSFDTHEANGGGSSFKFPQPLVPQPIMSSDSSRSPSPMMEDLKLNAELTVELSQPVIDGIHKFCSKSGPYTMVKIKREQKQSEVQNLIMFLAKIENSSYKPENLTSMIEANATRCWQNLHFSVSHNRQIKNEIVKEFKILAGNCGFEQIVGSRGANLSDNDWKIFKETCLRSFVVVSDPSAPGKRTVRLKTEALPRN